MDHLDIEEYLEDLDGQDLRPNQRELVDSFKEQFDERGTLSDRQMDVLESMHDELC